MTGSPDRRRRPAGRRGGWWRIVSAAALGALLAGSPGAGPAGASGGTPHPDLAELGDVACTDCHDDRLSGEVVHPPVEECETCHEFAGEGDEVTVGLSLPVEELCTLCHDNPAAEGLASRHLPVVEAMCTSCHNPHSTDAAHLLPDELNFCLDCHVEVDDQVQRPVVHGVIESLGCTACHDPHGSAHGTLLRGSGNGLCLECHGERPAAGEEVAEEAAEEAGGEEGGEEEAMTAIFESRAVPRAAFDAFPRVKIDAGGRGHPVAKHPTEADSDPLNPDRRFGCTSCHEPHGAFRASLIAGEAGGSLCFRCHRK